MLYFYTVLIAHNNGLLLKGNTFANNSGGNVYRSSIAPNENPPFLGATPGEATPPP